MTDRRLVIESFLRETGWDGAKLNWLPGDASFRRYARLVGGPRPALLMDAPPDREDIRPYLQIAERLAALGLSAPAILADAAGRGLAVIEDFGDETYTVLLDAGSDPEPLYASAVDALIALHQHPLAEAGAGVAPYSDEDFTAEHALLTDWYAPAAGCPVNRAGRDAYLALWEDLLPKARATGDVLVLRDFHVDNLMRLQGRAGIRACGLLDFQDARAGPRPYDLQSLLQDARRDVDADLARLMTERYLAAFPDLDRDCFFEAGTVLAAQRHCKVLGIFTRLAERDGKPAYLRHIPRLWRMLESCLEHPVLADLRNWLDAALPAERRRLVR